MKKTWGKRTLVRVSLLALMMFTLLLPLEGKAKAKPKLNKTSVSLLEGWKVQLRVKNSTKKFKWKTGSKRVASVSSSGQVTAVSAGTTSIPAVSGKTKLSCEVALFAGDLDVRQKVLATGNSYPLQFTGSKEVSRWVSTNPSVLTVTRKGKVTGLQSGTAKVRAVIGDSRISCKFIILDPVTDDESRKNVKGSWMNKYGETYYIYPDNAMLVGSRKIGSVYYVFDMNGALQKPEKKSIVDVGRERYYVSPSGKALQGWHVIEDELYYAEEDGRILRDQTFEGIVLGEDGAAKDTDVAKWQKVVSQRVDSLVNDSMSKSQKLKACWNYMVSKKNFRYRLRYPNLNKSGWQKETAWNMLTTHSGNCYSFACAFAAMAHTIGYTIPRPR